MTVSMWCTNCGVRLAQEEVTGWGCPKCGCEGVPCDPTKDIRVEVNWHELHVLCCWADFWAGHVAAREGADESAAGMGKTVRAIAGRLERQWPEFNKLTLFAEVAALPDQLAAKGRIVTSIETNAPDAGPILELGPGAVGHGRDRDAAA